MKLKMLSLIAGLACLAGTQGQAQSCPVPGNAAQLESILSQGINQVRQANARASLQPDRQLSAAARAHACDMAVNGFFDHRGSDGSNSQRRVRQAGFRDCLVAENLAWGYSDPNRILNGWLASSGHRRNMLLDRAQEFGVGVAMGARGPVWVLVVARSC